MKQQGQEPGESSMLRPSWFTSTLMARRLLAFSTIGTVSTVFPPILRADSRIPPAVASMSISLPEYIADCEETLSVSGDDNSEGNPIFLGLYISVMLQPARTSVYPSTGGIISIKRLHCIRASLWALLGYLACLLLDTLLPWQFPCLRKPRLRLRHAISPCTLMRGHGCPGARVAHMRGFGRGWR